MTETSGIVLTTSLFESSSELYKKKGMGDNSSILIFI